MRALHENKHLAMEFWSLVSRLTRERTGQDSKPDWILDTILVGVTGEGVAEATASPGAQRLLVRRLQAMLAGEDVASPPEIPKDLPQEPELSSDFQQELDRGDIRQELGSSDIRQELDRREFRQELDRRRSLPREPGRARSFPQESDHAESRREDIRIQFADTSDVVPIAPRSATPRSSPLLTAEPAPAASIPVERIPVDPIPHRVDATPIRAARGESQRLVLEPAPRPAAPQELNLHGHQIDQPMAIPLAAYADAAAEGSTGRKVLGGMLLALLICGGLLAARYRNSPELTQIGDTFRNGYGVVMASLHRQMTRQPANSTIESGNSSPASAAGNMANPVVASAAPAASTAPPTSAELQPPSEPVTQAAAATRSESTRPELAPPPAPSKVAKNIDSPNTETYPDEPQILPKVVVPSDEMRAHLISSRIPIRPEGMSAREAQGLIVIRAIVSKQGIVEQPRAIAGKPALRQAAIDAVAKWRYMPYRVNGQPADVTTTITVDFAGNDE